MSANGGGSRSASYLAKCWRAEGSQILVQGGVVSFATEDVLCDLCGKLTCSARLPLNRVREIKRGYCIRKAFPLADQEAVRVIGGEVEQAKVETWFRFNKMSFRAVCLMENGFRARRLAEEARKEVG